MREKFKPVEPTFKGWITSRKIHRKLLTEQGKSLLKNEKPFYYSQILNKKNANISWAACFDCKNKNILFDSEKKLFICIDCGKENEFVFKIKDI